MRSGGPGAGRDRCDWVLSFMPLFGFVNQVEERGGQAIPKIQKILLLYFIAIFAGFYLHSVWIVWRRYGAGQPFGHSITVGRNELPAIPLALVWARFLQYSVFLFCQRGVKIDLPAPLKLYKGASGSHIPAVWFLGGVGMLLPFTMFAGSGYQMEVK